MHERQGTKIIFLIKLLFLENRASDLKSVSAIGSKTAEPVETSYWTDMNGVRYTPEANSTPWLLRKTGVTIHLSKN